LAGERLRIFPGGVYFVPLAAISDPALIVSVIGQTLGIRESGGQSPLETLKDFAESTLHADVAVLDNFEHLVSAASMLAELLAIGVVLLNSCDQSRAPCTCRRTGISCPSPRFPGFPVLAPSRRAVAISAIALFVQRASAIKPDFELTEQKRGGRSRNFARGWTSALAIELAAARTRLCALRYAERGSRAACSS